MTINVLSFTVPVRDGPIETPSIDYVCSVVTVPDHLRTSSDFSTLESRNTRSQLSHTA